MEVLNKIDWATLFAGLTILTPLLIFILQRQSESKRHLKDLISERKFEAYSSLQDVFWGLFNEVVGARKDKHAQKLLEAQKLLFMYASDAVIKEYILWRENSTQGTLAGLESMLKVFVAMRKDFFDKHTKISTDDFLKVLIGNGEDYKKIRRMIDQNEPIKN